MPAGVIEQTHVGASHLAAQLRRKAVRRNVDHATAARYRLLDEALDLKASASDLAMIKAPGIVSAVRVQQPLSPPKQPSIERGIRLPPCSSAVNTGAEFHVVHMVECCGNCLSSAVGRAQNLTQAFAVFGVLSVYQIRGPKHVVI
jgi:hypothetical protein